MSLTVGVVGVGIIGAPFVRGLVTARDDVSVALSPRSADKAAALAAEFPAVTVMASNQAVLDASEWVVLAVLRPAAEAIVRDLRFRPDHRVVSLIGGLGVETVRAWTGPVAEVTRMVPLPFVAHRVGPLATYPLTPTVEAAFGGLGELVGTPDESALDALVTVTSMMSPYFAVVGAVAGWAAAHGATPEAAQRFTLEFFEALLYKAKTLSPGELSEHWREMTPGGLNHTAMTHLTAAGAVAAWPEAMDQVLARIHESG